ncbi:MAG: hypothetical protein NVS3B18_11540 [Candidatus Dormibacteria bacterium]
MDPTQVLRGSDGTFRCRECGFHYALDGAGIIATCTRAADDVRTSALAVPEPRRSHRIAPAVWSPNAYCAHLADASELIEGRVRRIATEDRPFLRGYDQDAAAERGHFDDVPVEPSLHRIDAAVGRFVALVATLPDSAWARVGVHEEAGDIVLRDLAHDMPHELVHHAGDLRRLGHELGVDPSHRPPAAPDPDPDR